MLQFGTIPTSVLITNHATDAMNAVVRVVKIKFRKLKKEQVRQ